MNTWKAKNNGRLLTEVKNKFSMSYTTKDLRWSIEHNRCFVNNKIERFGSAKIKQGDTISISIERLPVLQIEKKRILFEDNCLLCYDKPPFISSENLAEICHCHLVHRLDRDTSGVILLAKTRHIQLALENQFRQRSIHKEYLAIVEGTLTGSGIISGKMAPLKKTEGSVFLEMSTHGVWSKTLWKSLYSHNNISLLQCVPITGRTHQIRVHLKSINHPIVGDYVYGSLKKKYQVFRPLLHAAHIEFIHPETRTTCSLQCPLPTDFSLLPFNEKDMLSFDVLQEIFTKEKRYVAN